MRGRLAAMPAQRRNLLVVGAVAVALALLTTLVTLTRADSRAVAAPDAGYGLWGTDTLPLESAASDNRRVDLGTIFSVDQPGAVTAVQFFRVQSNSGPHRVALHTLDGVLLATAEAPESLQAGWVTAALDRAVPVEVGEYYVASYRAPRGNYSIATEALSWDSPITTRAITAWQSRFRYRGQETRAGWRESNYFVGPVFLPDDATAVSPSGDAATGLPPSGSAGSMGVSWPGPDNTGVPAGVSLRPYTGPETITKAGTVLDAQEIVGPLVIAAPDVVISRSRIEGTINADGADASIKIVDSEIDGGPGPAPAVGYHRVTVLRSEITGGQHSILCGDDCRVEDSWLHDQSLPPGEEYHNNAFISNGGSRVVLRGNRLACTPVNNGSEGGCSTNLSLFGDFAPIQDVEISDNLFEATPGGYCGSFGWNEAKRFGRQVTGVVVTGNVFERGSSGRCGAFGAVTSFADSGGGAWRDNTWLEGGTVAPR